VTSPSGIFQAGSFLVMTFAPLLRAVEIDSFDTPPLLRLSTTNNPRIRPRETIDPRSPERVWGIFRVVLSRSYPHLAFYSYVPPFVPDARSHSPSTPSRRVYCISLFLSIPCAF